MIVLKMGMRNTFIETAFRFRHIYTKGQLKEKYRYALSLNCFTMARLYLFAIYGKKEPTYDYKWSGGTLYAYEYPSIKA